MKIPLFALCLVALAATASGYAAFGGPMGRALTPEERLMYVQQQRGPDWRRLTLQQRCERQHQMRAAWTSMRPADLQKLKQQLDAKWNALPAAEKNRFEQRIQRRIANRRARRTAAAAGPRQRPCAATNGSAL